MQFPIHISYRVETIYLINVTSLHIFQKNIYHDRGWTWKRQTGHLHKSNGRNGNNTKANMAI